MNTPLGKAISGILTAAILSLGGLLWTTARLAADNAKDIKANEKAITRIEDTPIELEKLRGDVHHLTEEAKSNGEANNEAHSRINAELGRIQDRQQKMDSKIEKMDEKVNRILREVEK